MPSPIAHLTAGYIVYRVAREVAVWKAAPARGAERQTTKSDSKGELLLAALTFSMLPDIDSVVGLLAGDFGRFHNNATHSMLVGVVAALAFAGAMRWRGRASWLWFLVAASGYLSHVLMDGATAGRGVMALWPINNLRYSLPVTLFYGVRWSDGLFSVHHLWTVGTEMLFAMFTFLFWWVWPTLKHGFRLR